LSLFCTISTTSHLFKSLALADSLNKFGYKLYVLLVDAENTTSFTVPDNVSLFNLSTIHTPIVLAIINKYSTNKDKLRWALKPVWLTKLLSNSDKVIYVDNDIYFYTDPGFLFDELSHHRVLLTPHFYPANPTKNQNWLEANLRVGLFNAGFFAANRHALDILEWWSECCMYKLTKSASRGLFDDQKYLDILPVKFDGVKVLKHKGCNLAGWNAMEYTLQANNEVVLIERDTPIVFIHFAELSMRLFSNQGSIFFPYYQTYIDTLRKYKSDYMFSRNYFSYYQISSFIQFLIWKVKRMME
jgi:lipopolysaccharide biosynthesis glycosyltransferase